MKERRSSVRTSNSRYLQDITEKQLVDELVDVHVMVEQLILMFDVELSFNKVHESKVERLQGRLLDDNTRKFNDIKDQIITKLNYLRPLLADKEIRERITTIHERLGDSSEIDGTFSFLGENGILLDSANHGIVFIDGLGWCFVYRKLQTIFSKSFEFLKPYVIDAGLHWFRTWKDNWIPIISILPFTEVEPGRIGKDCKYHVYIPGKDGFIGINTIMPADALPSVPHAPRPGRFHKNKEDALSKHGEWLFFYVVKKEVNDSSGIGSLRFYPEISSNYLTLGDQDAWETLQKVLHHLTAIEDMIQAAPRPRETLWWDNKNWS